MVQRSRIAPVSDLRSLGKRGGKAPSRPARAALRNVAVLVLLVGLVFALPQFFGPGFFHDRARGVVAFATAAGSWVRAALAAAFQSIPAW